MRGFVHVESTVTFPANQRFVARG